MLCRSGPLYGGGNRAFLWIIYNGNGIFVSCGRWVNAAVGTGRGDFLYRLYLCRADHATGRQHLARRCIKAVAGLYILVAFARTVPQAHVQLRAFLVPVQEPVSIASPETAILAQTQAQLEQTLAEQWCTKTGREASVAVMLKETDSVVAICSAQMTLPANCTAEERQQAGTFLQEKLQLLPKQIRIAAAGEETP